MSFTINGEGEFGGTQSVQIPSGNTATRPASADAGEIRFNTDTGKMEYWSSTSDTPQWRSINENPLNVVDVDYLVVGAGGGGSGSNANAPSGNYYVGLDGTDSVFHTQTAGGGGGAGRPNAPGTAGNGRAANGSGGGGTYNGSPGTGNGTGGDGGTGYQPSPYAGGGGGGAGGNGALFRLLRTPSKDWTDYGAAQMYGALYAEGVREAEQEARAANTPIARSVKYGGYHTSPTRRRYTQYR